MQFPQHPNLRTADAAIGFNLADMLLDRVENDAEVLQCGGRHRLMTELCMISNFLNIGLCIHPYYYAIKNTLIQI